MSPFYGPYVNIDGWGRVRISYQFKRPKVHPLKKEFSILGLSVAANVKKVKQRYRELALLNHPDKGGDPLKMCEINLAYKKVLEFLTRRRSLK